MKTLTTIFCLTGALLLVIAEKSFALPSCPSNPNAYYDNCFGNATYANGDKYFGEFKDDKRNLHGTLTYANGDKHVGEFKDDKRNGQGTYISANGDKYAGQFTDDQRSGHGTYIFANGGKYVGQFKNDKYNGLGIYIFSNGDRYVGQFTDDKANGQGTLTYGNGNQYDYDNKDKSQNPFTYADGKVKKRAFKINLTLHSGVFITALQKWRTLAEQGNADAQYNVGWIYQYVQDIPQDYRTAVKWYRLAAEQGHIDAQNYLGTMYEKGKGVPQDDKVAMKWWKLAAEQGSIQAQNNLGWMHDFNGDYKTAVKWYKLAAEQGYAHAQYNLGFIYDFKHEDFKNAVKWYKLAAEQGVARAQKRLKKLQKWIIEEKPTPIVNVNDLQETSSETQRELERLRKEIIQLIKKEKKISEPQLIPKKSISALGYLISTTGHIITNQHIVSKCNKITVRDSAEKFYFTEVINIDRENDLALLKISPLKMSSVGTKDLIQKLGVKIVTLASDSLLRAEDLDLGVKASKVRQFLVDSGLAKKWPQFSKNISTKELAKIIDRQAVRVICHR